MSTNRRGFFARIIGTAGAAVVNSAIKDRAPQAASMAKTHFGLLAPSGLTIQDCALTPLEAGMELEAETVAGIERFIISSVSVGSYVWRP